jgi:hypothetical protein
MASGAAQGDSGVDVFTLLFFGVALDTFRGINVCWERHWMLSCLLRLQQ